MNVLVLGGFGFVGRHVAAVLRARDHDVVIGSRSGRPRANASCVRETRFENLVEASDWIPLLADVEAVVNCVGILRERPGETYDAIHHRAVVALAGACMTTGVRSFVHVSALGLGANSVNGFLTSKRAGDDALRRSGCNVTIVRPSLLDGVGGFGARWLRRLARLPVHVVPAEACGRIAVLDVEDLAAAIVRLTGEPATNGCREFELGGPDERSLAEHLRALRRMRTDRRAWTVRVPAPFARLSACLCDLVHFSPYSVGHLELLRHDNVPRTNALPALLGRTPHAVGVGVPAGPRVATSLSAKPSPRAPQSRTAFQSRFGAPSGKNFR